MSAPRRSLRIVDNAVKVANTSKIAKTANIPKKAKTANVANKAKTANVANTAKLNIVIEDGYDLSTELSKKTIAHIAKNIEDEEKYKITDEDWVEFFCEFFDYIQNNIDLCLSKIHGLNHLKIQDLYKVNFSAGGFYDDFNNDLKHNYNIGLYELFKYEYCNCKNSGTKSKLDTRYGSDDLLIIFVSENVNKLNNNDVIFSIVILNNTFVSSIFLLYK